MPRAEGHLLVIPKAPVRNILDMAPAEFARFMPSVQKVAKATKTAMAADGLSIMQFNEAAGGQWFLLPPLSHFRRAGPCRNCARLAD